MNSSQISNTVPAYLCDLFCFFQLRPGKRCPRNFCRFPDRQTGGKRRSSPGLSWPGDQHSASDWARERVQDRWVSAHHLYFFWTHPVLGNQHPSCVFVLNQGHAVIRSAWRQTTSVSFPVLDGSCTSTMWTSIHQWSRAACAQLFCSSMRSCLAWHAALMERCFSFHTDCRIRWILSEQIQDFIKNFSSSSLTQY